MNNLFPFLASLILLAGFNTTLTSQEVTPAQDLNYIVEEFVLPGGRLGNNVNAIVQGPYGFMWFGSHGGLHRYDGYEFVTYKTDPSDTIGETTSLSFHYVEGLFWDNDNQLWVTSYGGGLYRFDPILETFKHYAHDPEDSTTISNPRVLSAVQDASGQMWFGTEDGLNKFDPVTETFHRYYAEPDNPKALQDDDVRALYMDNAGTLWIGTGFAWFIVDGGGLSKYDPHNDSFTTYLHDPNDEKSIWSSPVRGMLEDSRGNFWVGTAKGLTKMDREEGSFQRMDFDPGQPFAPGARDLESSPVYSILEDQNGGLWIGTIMNPTYKSHLTRYDPKTRSSEVYPIQSSAWSMFESSDGTLWVAGAGITGKVLRLRQKQKIYDLTGGNFYPAFAGSDMSRSIGVRPTHLFGPFDMATDPTTNEFWMEMVVNVNEIYYAVLVQYDQKDHSTEFHLLNELDLNRDPSLPANQFGSKGMFVDANGHVWDSYPSERTGVFRYDPVAKEVIQYLHDPSDSTTITSNDIVTLMQDSRGEVWAATYDQGLNRINPASGEIKHYHFNQFTWNNNDAPIALMEANDGKIWVGGDIVDEGNHLTIVIIDPVTDEMTRIGDQNNNVFSMVHSMTQSKITGTVTFCIANNGIGTFDPVNGNFYYANAANGIFPYDNVSGVVCDDKGVFWTIDMDLGTIIRITEPLNYYSVQEASKSGGHWRSGILGSNGNIYFLSSLEDAAWIEIDPMKIRPELSGYSTKTGLVDLYVLGSKQKPSKGGILSKPLWLTEEVRLPASARSFALSFSDFDFQSTNPIFEYRLFPYESAWKRNGNSMVANYHLVPDGEYQFQLKSIRTGTSEDTSVELSVIVLPPWYLTLWAYLLYGVFFIMGVFGVHTIQKSRVIRKERERIKDKELAQAKEIEKAYHELKETQTQLIHSEKMASLGELTAGIAHEIQNPLNFVNNFSEVNTELAEELEEHIQKGEKDEAIEIVKDIIQNEKKIVHHGKRAEEIVKSMLQHSRGTEGKKEPTDLNVLADEYLRLAYHGMRAKDKSFNVSMETDLDPTIREIEVVPQDIGRVVLNLITNAFHAISDKQKASDNGFKPVLTLSTRKNKDKVEIKIKDNGTGIPPDIREKIFQPFFSTKGTGKGTGLGLSLSYDIITKGHGGKIDVNTTPGEGTEFIIELPLKS